MRFLLMVPSDVHMSLDVNGVGDLHNHLTVIRQIEYDAICNVKHTRQRWTIGYRRFDLSSIVVEKMFADDHDPFSRLEGSFA